MYKPEKELFLAEFCGGEEDMMQMACLRNSMSTAEGPRHSACSRDDGWMGGVGERGIVGEKQISKVIDAPKHRPSKWTRFDLR